MYQTILALSISSLGSGAGVGSAFVVTLGGECHPQRTPPPA